jgi:calcium-dependent protein kinase
MPSFLIDKKVKLGFGNFGVVYLAERVEDHVKFAAKVFEENRQSSCVKEIAILKHISYYTLRHVLDVKEVMQFNSGTAIIMECCHGGDVFNKILECGTFSESKAAHCMMNLTLGKQPKCDIFSVN